MRHGYLLLVATSCGFQTPGRAPDGAVPDGIVSETWKLDAASDFAATGHVVKDMTIDGARGSLTPNAYTYGALAVHGRQDVKLWTADDTDWGKLQMVTESGAGLWRGEPFTDASAFQYLGIVNPRTITIWMEGEVWLEQGSTERFSLSGDDVAFVELARPGATSYTPMLKGGTAVDVAIPETGWYPIRIGFADGDNSRDFEFLHSDDATQPVPWTRDRLRARASELRGALRTIFNRQILGGGVGPRLPVSQVERTNLVTEASFNPTQGIDKGDDWSARYAGQLYVEQPGAYTLTIDSDDGNRGVLGTARDESAWGRDQGNGDAVTRIPATLGAGWNDLSVDYNQVSGLSNLLIRLTGGGLSNAEIPRDRLRPVESANDRLVFSIDDTDRMIPDANSQGPGTAIAQIPVLAFAGETITALELTYQITSSRWSDLEVKLERPGLATPVTIRPRGNGLPNGARSIQLSVPTTDPGPFDTLLDGPVAGAWRLHASDVVQNSETSLLQNAKLTLHTTGGPPKIAPIASWTSPALEVPTDVLAIDGITWDDRRPDGATVEIHVRTCQQAGCSDNPAWSNAVTSAAPLDVPRGRYLQLRVDMTSNGVTEPELRALNIAYRRDAN